MTVAFAGMTDAFEGRRCLASITGWRRRIKELANAINKLEGRARNAVNRNGMTQAAIDAGAVLDGGKQKLIDIDTEKEVEDDTETNDVNAVAA